MDPPSPKHSVSVSAAIVDDHGRILVIRRRDDGRWEPPGGVLELGETIHDGLRREVREETGLLVEPIAQTGTYKNMTRGIVALVFRCRITHGAAGLSDEVQDLRWLAPNEIASHLNEAFAVRMLDALDDGPPKIRAHDGHTLISEPAATPAR